MRPVRVLGWVVLASAWQLAQLQENVDILTPSRLDTADLSDD
jgi:hypothetical protein